MVQSGVVQQHAMKQGGDKKVIPWAAGTQTAAAGGAQQSCNAVKHGRAGMMGSAIVQE
jgi:hypothetical protein